jgi:hypothetical protein
MILDIENIKKGSANPSTSSVSVYPNTCTTGPVKTGNKKEKMQK